MPLSTELARGSPSERLHLRRCAATSGAWDCLKRAHHNMGLVRGLLSLSHTHTHTHTRTHTHAHTHAHTHLASNAPSSGLRCGPSRLVRSLERRYATFVQGIAGVDPTDHRAASAGLPPIDSVNHWDFLTGKTHDSPRTAIPLGSCSAAPDQDAFCQTEGHQQTIVNAVVAYLGEGKQRQLWKLIVGRVPLAGWAWPKYPGPAPNNTSTGFPTVSCGTPGVDGTGCLYNLDSDPTERNNLA